MIAALRTPDARLRAIVGASGIFGLFPLSLSPLIVAAMQAWGLGALQAGLLATCLLAGVSLSAIGFGAIATRLRLRALFHAGVLTVLAIQAIMLALPVHGTALACVLWFVSGIGSGCGIVVGDVVLARAARPTMTAAQALAVTSLMMLCVFPIGTAMLDWLGTITLPLLSVVSALAAWLLLYGIDIDGLAGARDPLGAASARRSGLDAPAFALLGAIALFWTRDGMIWAFSAANAARLGMTPGDVGLLLGGAGVCGVLGSCASAWVTRSDRVPAAVVVVPIVLAAVVASVWTLAADPTSFATLQLAYNALQLFSYPFLLGIAARMDPGGRLAAMAGGMTLLGAAIGPSAAGVAVDAYGAPGLTLTVTFVNAAGVAAALIALGISRRRGTAAPAAAPARSSDTQARPQLRGSR